MNNQDVTFRRIRGRIVPIKKTKVKSDATSVGLGEILVGAAVTAAIAKVGASKVLKGKRFLSASSSLLHGYNRVLNSPVNPALASSRLNKAIGFFKQGGKNLGKGERLLKAAPIVGGAIIGHGAGKVITGDENSPERAVTTAFAGYTSYKIAEKVLKRVAFPFLK